MIKFFRKIRRRLLTENKISKYLIYAIGEIVLVMIGILLALQVNNWNIAQKQEDRQKELTKSLALEVDEVLNYSRGQIEWMDQRINFFTKILNEWETFEPETIFKDSLFVYYWHIHTATIIKYNPQIGYYNSLINSGEIRLIPDSIALQLNAVYKKHSQDVSSYVNQEFDLHVIIATVVAKNHSKEFLSGRTENDEFNLPYIPSATSADYLNVLDNQTIINFLNSIKDDGELKSLLYRNLTLIKFKRFLLTARIIHDLNNLKEDLDTG